MVRVKWLSAAVLGSMVGMAASQLFAQADVIEKRQQLMKGQSAAVKAIKGAVETKDFATIETKAKDLMGSANQIPSAFPKGSTTGKTKATAAIWEKWDEFAGSCQEPEQSVQENSQPRPRAKTKTAVATKAKSIGDSCSSCHKAFRADKYSE